MEEGEGKMEEGLHSFQIVSIVYSPLSFAMLVSTALSAHSHC